LGLWDIDKVEDDWLILAEHITVGNSEQQWVTDLSGSTSNGDSDRLFGLRLSYGENVRIEQQRLLKDIWTFVNINYDFLKKYYPLRYYLRTFIES
jgi:hypothetical protein